MAGLGGFLGYALGAINWDITALGKLVSHPHSGKDLERRDSSLTYCGILDPLLDNDREIRKYTTAVTE
jgi:hypothetical protein